MAESSSQPREMKGPARLRGRSGAKARDAKKTAKRLLGYLRPYRWRLSAIMLFLIINAAAGAAGSMFLQILIDDYIEPLLLTASPVFTGLLRAISIMACIYLSGILSNFLMQRLMIKVSQGVLRDVRDAHGPFLDGAQQAPRADDTFSVCEPLRHAACLPFASFPYIV